MSRFEAPPGIVTNGLVLNLDAGDPDSYTRSQPPYVEVLVVAGGGGGGARHAGGGGAGGLIYNSAYQLTNAAAITVTVGAGGAGAFNSFPSFTPSGGTGSNSVFGSLTAIGGGGGGSWNSTQPGTTGGSGGGNINTTQIPGTPGQGFNGGGSNNNASPYNHGGGGGASEPGQNGQSNKAGDGGDGQAFAISGTSTYYAGGGAGGSHPPSGTPAVGGLGGGGNEGPNNGTINTGGGGGGGTLNTGGGDGSGGSGGSGIVIVRYPGLPAATGGTITYLNGYTIHTFTSSGTFTPYLWNDLSGGGWNGTLVNGVGFISYQNGGILDFDGSDDYADLGNPTVLRNLTSGSIEAVYYRDASTGTYQMVFTDAGSDLEITYLGNTLQFYIGNSGISYTHAVTGQWFYVAGIWTTGSKKLYLNGTEVASGTNTGINTGNRDRYIGGRGASFPFNGKIPIVRVYNRTLSATEITQNFNAQRARFGI